MVLALSAGNVISPSGNLHLGDLYPVVPTNALIKNLQDLARFRSAKAPRHGYLRNIGTVEDATDMTTGYALVNGRRAVYILATKRAEASTMSVIARSRAPCRRCRRNCRRTSVSVSNSTSLRT